MPDNLVLLLQIEQAAAALALKIGQGKKGGKPMKVCMHQTSVYKTLVPLKPAALFCVHLPAVVHHRPHILLPVSAQAQMQKVSLQGFKSGSQRRLSVQIPVRDESAKAVSPPHRSQP